MFVLFLNFGCSIAIVSLPITQSPTNSSFVYSMPNLFNINSEFEIQQTGFKIPPPGTGLPFLESCKFVISAFIQLILIIPIHFYLCYWPLYKAMGSLNTIRFLIFFISYGLAIVFDIFSMTGIYNLGASGIYLAYLYWPVTNTQGSLPALIINCVLFGIWGLLLICHIVLVLQVFILFRRENYYMKRLGTYIKKCCTQCCTAALKKSVKKPTDTAPPLEENGIVE